MTETGIFEFGVPSASLEFAVWDLFGIWCLEFVAPILEV
jgi:hypothetical protein